MIYIGLLFTKNMTWINEYHVMRMHFLHILWLIYNMSLHADFVRGKNVVRHKTFDQRLVQIQTSCPLKMMRQWCHAGSVDSFNLTKCLNACWSFSMNSVPGVMQLLSNRLSSGNFSFAFFARSICSAAVLADWNLNVMECAHFSV